MRIEEIIKNIIPFEYRAKRAYKRFDENIVIYKGVTYRQYLEEALMSSRSDIYGEDLERLRYDIFRVWHKEKMRPDEYLLYNFDKKSERERAEYLSRHSKDHILINYYGETWKTVLELLKNKYSFSALLKPYFKRDIILLQDDGDSDVFKDFCEKHDSFICTPLKGNCGAGVHIIRIAESSVKICDIFQSLISQGSWIIEELILQNKAIAAFNESSINTVRFPSFRHGGRIEVAYPCMRFGRQGSIVDNAGQGGVFVSIDVNTGEIITDGYDERGNSYSVHPDSRLPFKGFMIPQWGELLEEIRKAHLSLPEEQVYVAFDFALSEKGWMIVEGNWGDFILQQASMNRGMRSEFMSLLEG